jgi:hypothetical protein
MTIASALRVSAVALVVAGVIEPSWTVSRSAPVPVEVRPAQEGSNAMSLAAVQRVRERLAGSLGDHVSLDAHAEPAAVVIVGRSISASELPADRVSVSTVALTDPATSVRIVAVPNPPAVPVGWTTPVTATIEARGMRGTTSRIALEQAGAEIVGLDHRWTSDVERFDARLPYTPASEGPSLVTLRAASARADLRVTGTGRLKILVYEPRPSWAAAFVRRALEADAMFDVSSFVHASNRVDVRAGAPPLSLTFDALSGFAVVVIGAPEELRPPDVDALRAFARRRGGTIVLLPDRRPSGPFVGLVPVKRFDELLVDSGLELRVSAGAPIRASEFAVPADGVSGADEFAAIDQGSATKPVIVSWPMGAGNVVFSGALDAWRFRAAAGDAFGRFWRARIGEAALSAPPRVEVSLNPPVAGPGEGVKLHVRLRPTELAEVAGGSRTPVVRARLVGEDADELVRLWPVAEDGAFEGTIEAPSPGTYDVQVTTDAGAAGDDLLTVIAEARHPEVASNDGRDSLQLAAGAMGGTAVDESDPAPLERQLRTLQGGTTPEKIRPTRSAWFAGTTIALLCAEWALRRRRGQP